MVRPGDEDFAVNVVAGPPPAWLTEAVEAAWERIGAYPDEREARAAIAARHGVDARPTCSCSTARPRGSGCSPPRPPCRAAILMPVVRGAGGGAAGARARALLVRRSEDDGFRLTTVPEDADLVFVTNPCNPTGVLHRGLETLARPGRTLVVDESFMDFVEPPAAERRGRAAHRRPAQPDEGVLDRRPARGLPDRAARARGTPARCPQAAVAGELARRSPR